MFTSRPSTRQWSLIYFFTSRPSARKWSLISLSHQDPLQWNGHWFLPLYQGHLRGNGHWFFLYIKALSNGMVIDFFLHIKALYEAMVIDSFFTSRSSSRQWSFISLSHQDPLQWNGHWFPYANPHFFLWTGTLSLGMVMSVFFFGSRPSSLNWSLYMLDLFIFFHYF